jgi:deazaflavin-dependent oxidoreductase (nitroreductase family)
MPDTASNLPPWHGVAPIGILDRVRQVNRAILNPVVRRVAGRLPAPLVLLRHRGRTSGRLYTTPLIAQRIFDGYIVPLTYGERADWVKNVRAAGKAELLHGGAAHGLISPVILDEHEALPLLEPLLRIPAQAVGIRRFLRLQNATTGPRA